MNHSSIVIMAASGLKKIVARFYLIGFPQSYIYTWLDMTCGERKKATSEPPNASRTRGINFIIKS